MCLFTYLGVTPGDIKFVIEEKPHPKFTRKGDDLEHKRNITLTQALCGVEFGVEAIDGSTVHVDCTGAPVKPHDEKIYPGKGMINSKTNKRGALVVKFDIIFPSKLLSNEQKEFIKKANLDKNM